MRQQRINLSTPVEHLHRRSDPQSSRKAIKQLTDSGKRLSQAQRIVMVMDTVPRTASEIGQKCNLTQIQTSRRLPELETDDYVIRLDERKCSIVKSKCDTWIINQLRQELSA